MAGDLEATDRLLTQIENAAVCELAALVERTARRLHEARWKTTNLMIQNAVSRALELPLGDDTRNALTALRDTCASWTAASGEPANADAHAVLPDVCSVLRCAVVRAVREEEKRSRHRSQPVAPWVAYTVLCGALLFVGCWGSRIMAAPGSSSWVTLVGAPLILLGVAGVIATLILVALATIALTDLVWRRLPKDAGEHED